MILAVVALSLHNGAIIGHLIGRFTAILGILSIHTLGFYVDSAFVEIRFDRALALILVTALLNIGVDALSRAIRARLRLRTTPDFG